MQRTTLLEGLRHLVDVLVEGYATLNRRLWVLAIPIGLDLFLWLGPRISPLRLAESLVSFLGGVALVDPELVAQATKTLQGWGGQANLTHLLVSPMIPGLLPRLAAPALPGYAPPVWTPDSIWVLPLIALLALAVSLVLWSLYMVPLADLVRESGERGPAMLRRIPLLWWRMAQFLGLALVVASLFILLATGLMLFSALAIPALSFLVLYVGGAAALWVIFYFYFTPSAILLSGVAPRRALMYSVQVVRSSIWSSLGFILLTFLIQIGTGSLWQRLAGYPLAVLIGILANAYITGGLATAGLVFYREQLRQWLARSKEQADRQRPRTVL